MFSDGTQWKKAGQRQISYVTGSSEDSRQSGAVTGRAVSFTKASASSRLRITYSDNFGMYSVNLGKAACWTVNLDGSPISNPAPIRVCLYANVGSTSGILRRSDAVVGYAEGVAAGLHTLTVTVGPAPGYEGQVLGIVTGWPSGYSSFLLEVEELP